MMLSQRGRWAIVGLMSTPEQYSQRWGGCQPSIRLLVDHCTTALSRVSWPARCVLCSRRGQRGLDLCEACEQDLPLNLHACPLCAQPLAPSAAGLRCGACARRRPPFDASTIPYAYRYPLAHLVRAVKYRGQVACGRVLGDLLVRRLLQDPRAESWPQGLIPVPLGDRRYAQRGYNQADELARRVSRALVFPILRDAVVRTRETVEQAGLGGLQRRRNLRRAFAVVRPLQCTHVAILDDVVTTGSTASELARTLRRAGAKRIEVWAVARAGWHST